MAKIMLAIQRPAGWCIEMEGRLRKKTLADAFSSKPDKPDIKFVVPFTNKAAGARIAIDFWEPQRFGPCGEE
jgi:hypothetical protein